MHVLIKIVMVTIAALCACWGGILVLDAAKNFRTERVATRIILGESFSNEFVSDLAASAPRNEQRCNPALRRAIAILDVNLLEEAYTTADGPAIDGRLGNLEASTAAALACTPTDAFLWCVRYWVNVVKYGFRDEFLADLNLSYELGPNEAWIAAKRNRLALAVLARLSPQVQEVVIAEFAGMVDAGLTEQAGNNLVGTEQPTQQRLIASLKETRIISREWLAKWLRKGGYHIDVPGVDLPEERPWR